MRRKTSLSNIMNNRNISKLMNIYESTYQSDYINYFNTNRSFNKNQKHNIKVPKIKREKSFNYKSSNKFYSKILCPGCFNEKIMKIKSKIKNQKLDVYNYVYKKDNLRNKNNLNKSFDKGLFSGDIDYGFLRSRKRELANDNLILGTSFSYNNKSWDNKNHLLKGKEYYEIINKQIENKKVKSYIEKENKINEENKCILYQLLKEKCRQNEDKKRKLKRIKEVNKINEELIDIKKIKKLNEKDLKKKEGEIVLFFCKKQKEEKIKKDKDRKKQVRNIDNENFVASEINKKRKKNEKNLENKIKEKDFVDLFMNRVEKQRCQQCFRQYPKKLLSPFYYSYNIEQNNF